MEIMSFPPNEEVRKLAPANEMLNHNEDVKKILSDWLWSWNKPFFQTHQIQEVCQQIGGLRDDQRAFKKDKVIAEKLN